LRRSDHENELQGVAFACRTIDEDGVRRSTENSEYRWMSPDEALDIQTEKDPGTIWFRKTIERAEALRTIASAGWLDIHAFGVTLD
jgi:hypothetical protein